MGNTEVVSLAVGALIPFIITILKQVKLPRSANLAIAAIVCAGAGAITAWATGSLTSVPILTAMATVFIAAQAVYAAYWKDAPAEAKLNQLTSITSSPPTSNTDNS